MMNRSIETKSRTRHWTRTIPAAAALAAAVMAGVLAPVPAAAQRAPAAGANPAPKERVAAIKTSFAQSQAKLRDYEWIETTVVSLKGEEKSRTQNRCYYGAEGKVQKVPVAAPPEEKAGRGLRGRIKEKKKEELSDYMEQAAALVHRYLPPDQERIQRSTDAGKTSIHILEPNKRARIDFRDYLQPGDVLGVEIDLANNHILGLSVTSALDKDPVALVVRFDQFPDGTIYTAQNVLDATAKQVKVVVENSGYRKTGPASGR